MKLPHARLLSLLLGSALLCASSACDQRAQAVDAGGATAQPAAPVRAPTAQRLTQRAQERWNKIMKGDNIAAYDFQVPEAKRELSLATYDSRLRKHRYENAHVDEIISLKGEDAFVRISVLWTPIDEVTRRVKLDPGQTLTQDLTMVETWRFIDGDWSFVRPERDTDFFENHPELLRQDETQAEKPTQAPAQDAGGH